MGSTTHLDWTMPNPDAVMDPVEPPLPDTDSLLAELGATYPAVAYPAQQEGGEEALDEAIYAGLVFP
jgi:hypothetical protein